MPIIFSAVVTAVERLSRITARGNLEGKGKKSRDQLLVKSVYKCPVIQPEIPQIQRIPAILVIREI